MFDIALTGFLAALLVLGVRRPFLWVLAYLYVDIVAPQKLSYGLLTTVPISLITFCLALFGWFFLDQNKKGTAFSFRQGLILMLLLYCGMTTMSADFPEYAQYKWDWVWKALVFAMFLPLTLRTRLRVEAVALTMVLSAGAIIISGAIKTLFSGGGYGTLRLLVSDNTGLYEGSTLSCVAVAIIPLVLWLTKHGTIYKPEKRVTLFAAGLIFACLLIPVGTEARTGLMCAGLLAILMLRSVKKKSLYIIALPVALLVALPLLPSSFTTRMGTIENNQSDTSAQTRVAVWKWTLGYSADHPLGGGFDSFRGNHVKVETTTSSTNANGVVTSQETNQIDDNARAFHSAYFEMLGEQGWPGLVMWLVLQISGIVQLETMTRRLRRSEDPRDQSDAALGLALQQGQMVYMFGALFVGIAFQPFVYMLIGLQIGLVEQVRRRQREARKAQQDAVRGITMQPLGGQSPAPLGAS